MGSRRAFGGCVAAAILCGAVAVPAQSQDQASRLVVWVVHPTAATAPGYGSAVRSAPGYGTQSAGSFGDSASNFGTAASNVGVSTDSPVISREAAVARAQAAQDHGAPVASATYREETAGDFGQTASSAGTAASDHGKAPSTVGASAGSVGTAAGSYGQSAGSFGNSVSTLAQASQPVAAEAPGGLVQLAATKFTAVHPNVRLRFVTMDVDKVAPELRADANSPTLYPDVLVFENFPPSWPGPPAELARLAAIHMASNPLATRGMSTAPGALSTRVGVVLPRSGHRPEAQAFEDFLENEGALKALVNAR